MARLRRAMEASWDPLTAYQGIIRQNDPAYGQCYPTSRVVQWFYPEAEIAVGNVWTGESLERHFWNVFHAGAEAEWIDMSWQQFPDGSVVRDHQILERDSLGDSAGTLERCALLLRRVEPHLAADHAP